MIAWTSSKQWIHFFLSERCPPASNIRKRRFLYRKWISTTPDDFTRVRRMSFITKKIYQLALAVSKTWNGFCPHVSNLPRSTWSVGMYPVSLIRSISPRKYPAESFSWYSPDLRNVAWIPPSLQSSIMMTASPGGKNSESSTLEDWRTNISEVW